MVVGIGVVPNVELADAAGLEVDNGIVVDEYGRTRNSQIYAAGDVTSHFNSQLGRHVRLVPADLKSKRPFLWRGSKVFTGSKFSILALSRILPESFSRPFKPALTKA